MQTVSNTPGRRTRRLQRIPVALTAMMVLTGSGSTLAAQEDDGPRHPIRVNHPHVVVTVMLGSTGTFEEVPTFEVAFTRSPEGGTPVLVIETGAQGTLTTIPVYFVEPAAPDFAQAVSIDSCALEEGVPIDCRPVRAAVRLTSQRKVLQARLDQRVDWRRSLLRLRIPAGIFRLSRALDDDGWVGNPLVETVLPILGDRDLRFVESRPYFAFEITPIARAAAPPAGSEPREAASLDFRGGAYRSSREHQWGFGWSGSIGTVTELTFNRLRGLLEYERNLRTGDFLPVDVAFVSESDQRFDVVDTSLTAGVRYLLPLHVNRSPFSAFVPATGPKVRLSGGMGRRARGAVNPEKNFRRVGYDLQWRVPISADAVIAVHHAGLWAWDDFRTSKGEFHDLWDLLIETRIGQLTYFIGYQRGEAAPLFQPINTTRAGLIVRFR